MLFVSLLDYQDVSKDLLGKLMVARYEDSAEGATDQELRDQVLSLLIAGHEVGTAATQIHVYMYSV